MDLKRRELFQLAALSQISGGAAFEPIQAALKKKEPITWVFTGDSITHGALHTMGWRSYPEHFAERVRWELHRSHDIVINTGISGDRITGLLKASDWRVHRFQPHVVSLMMGMNDCALGPGGRETFRQGLKALHAEVKQRNGILLLHTANCIWAADMEKERRKDLPAYVEIVRELAAAEHLPLVDHYRHWQETRKNKDDLIYLLSDANIHPNQYGHTEMAKLLFRNLGIFDDGSRTCRLFVP